MKKKILILGASGFIGRNLFETLGQYDSEYEIVGTYHTRKFSDDPRLRCVDLTNRQAVKELFSEKFDVVVHAAAVTSGAKNIVSRPQMFVTDNTIINTQVLEAAFEIGVSHFIFLSCTVMYPMDVGPPVREDDCNLQSGIHKNYFGVAWMKVYTEKLCEFYSRIGSTMFTVVRHTNIYGPYDKYNDEQSHMFAATISKVMQAQDGDEIVVWGDGTEWRDVLHVSDLVNFIEHAIAMQNSPFQVVNVGYGYSYNVWQLVEETVKASGKKLTIRYDASRPTIPSYLRVNIEKASTLFDWKPAVSQYIGIRKTIDWYKQTYTT